MLGSKVVGWIIHFNQILAIYLSTYVDMKYHKRNLTFYLMIWLGGGGSIAITGTCVFRWLNC